MAEKRDVIDELIDLQQDWQAVRNPLGDVANQLMADPDELPQYNPSDYKDTPRTANASCLRTASAGKDVCRRCADVCPTAAIDFDGAKVKINENCRKCGLCIAACPTEAMVAQRQMSRQLYDRIARVASAYEQCYVTCTRALGRIPKDNEVVLPCVGVVSSDLWFSLLADYGNISVYLPLGICDRCRTTTGEEFFADAIADAEEHSCEHVGLEVDEAALTHELSRAYKRKQFMSSMSQAGTQLLTRGAPPLAGAAAVANRIKAHTDQINALQRTLEQATGGKTAQSRRRILTQKRKLVLSTLQSHPELARGMSWQVPSCDLSRCTMCGDCATACPQHACSLDESGRFGVEPTYCVNCGACAAVCPEGALTMVAADPASMVVPDPAKERVAKQKAQIEDAKRKGRKAAKTGLSALETFANELSAEFGDKK
jgi:ferredoxin